MTHTTTGIQFKKRRSTRWIMLHDSHTTPDQQRAVSLLKWQGRKLGLLECGYHFVIDRDGTRTETRPMALIGAACPGFDMEAIHICLIGGLGVVGPKFGRPTGAADEHFPEDNFKDEQWETLFDTIRMLKGFYGPVTIMGHSEARRGRHTTEHGGNCPPVDMADVRDNYAQWRLQHHD